MPLSQQLQEPKQPDNFAHGVSLLYICSVLLLLWRLLILRLFSASIGSLSVILRVIFNSHQIFKSLVKLAVGIVATQLKYLLRVPQLLLLL